MNMNVMLEMAVQQWPENLFLVREGVTYSAFMEQVKARAVTLMEHGIQVGDTVGLLSHNIPEFPVMSIFTYLLYLKNSSTSLYIKTKDKNFC